MDKKLEKILNDISELSVLELSELVKALEEKFDVKAIAMAAPAAGAAPAGAAPVVEEKTEFDVVITSAGTNKIAVIKAIQAITGLGLMDAKKLVDAAPALVKEKISPAEADGIKAKLVEAGASVEVK